MSPLRLVMSGRVMCLLSVIVWRDENLPSCIPTCREPPSPRLPAPSLSVSSSHLPLFHFLSYLLPHFCSVSSLHLIFLVSSLSFLLHLSLCSTPLFSPVFVSSPYLFPLFPPFYFFPSSSSLSFSPPYISPSLFLSPDFPSLCSFLPLFPLSAPSSFPFSLFPSFTSNHFSLVGVITLLVRVPSFSSLTFSLPLSSLPSSFSPLSLPFFLSSSVLYPFTFCFLLILYFLFL